MHQEGPDNFNLAKDISSGFVDVDARRILKGPELSRYIEREGQSVFRIAHAYWQSLYDASGRVSRKQLDPIELGPNVLPKVVLIDVVGDAPRRFRYRLVGSDAERIYGENYTGRFMDEMRFASSMKAIQQFYDTACNGSAPILLEGAYITRISSQFRVVRLAMPLSEESGLVTGLFCLMTKLDNSPSA